MTHFLIDLTLGGFLVWITSGSQLHSLCWELLFGLRSKQSGVVVCTVAETQCYLSTDLVKPFLKISCCFLLLWCFHMPTSMSAVICCSSFYAKICAVQTWLYLYCAFSRSYLYCCLSTRRCIGNSDVKQEKWRIKDSVGREGKHLKIMIIEPINNKGWSILKWK